MKMPTWISNVVDTIKDLYKSENKKDPVVYGTQAPPKDTGVIGPKLPIGPQLPTDNTTLKVVANLETGKKGYDSVGTAFDNKKASEKSTVNTQKVYESVDDVLKNKNANNQIYESVDDVIKKKDSNAGEKPKATIIYQSLEQLRETWAHKANTDNRAQPNTYDAPTERKSSEQPIYNTPPEKVSNAKPNNYDTVPPEKEPDTTPKGPKR